MVRENTNIVESCSVIVNKKFSENAQEQVTLTVSQEEEVADPTRENVFVCSTEDIAGDSLVYQWDFIDVTKGSKVILNDML